MQSHDLPLCQFVVVIDLNPAVIAALNRLIGFCVSYKLRNAARLLCFLKHTIAAQPHAMCDTATKKPWDIGSSQDL